MKPKISYNRLQTEFERSTIQYMDALYNFAMSLVGNKDDAKDLLQETYIKAFRFFDSFKPGTNCKAWLFQIMKNTFINNYRRTQRSPESVSYDEVEEFYDSVRSDDVSLDSLSLEIFEKSFGDEVQRALAILPEVFRTVLLLSDVEGFSYEEIATIVDIPVGTVRSRLHRARKAMFAQLKEYAVANGFGK